jgi:uncharacterized protein YoxC
VLRELITRPMSSFVALLELPRTMERSMREANELMEASRRQVESMRRQADDALQQAERMNDLLARIVRLTEPLEKAQRGGEMAAGLMKRVILGEEEAAQRVEEAVQRTEQVAEAAAERAEEAAEEADQAAAEASESGKAPESSERPEPLK